MDGRRLLARNCQYQCHLSFKRPSTLREEYHKIVFSWESPREEVDAFTHMERGEIAKAVLLPS